MLQSERSKRGETREYLHYYKLTQSKSLTASKSEAGKISASGKLHTKGQVALTLTPNPNTESCSHLGLLTPSS